MLADQFVSSWEELVNFDRLRDYRVKRVKAALAEKDLDALILFKSDNIRYATSLRPLIWEAGYQTRNMAIVVRDGSMCLFVASGDYQRVIQNDPWLKHVKPLASMEDAGISEKVVNDKFIPELKEMRLSQSRLGVDATTFYTIEFLRKAIKGGGGELVEGDEVMRKARAIKSPDEVRLIQTAAGIVDGGLYHASSAIDRLPTENVVAGAGLRAIYGLGTEWMPINPVVFSGNRPFRRFATEKKIARGENVVVNLSAMNDGYCAEETRTFVAGKASGRSSLRSTLRGIYNSLSLKLVTGARVGDIFSSFKGDAPRGTEAFLSIRGAGLSLTDDPLAENAEEGADQRLLENMVLVLEARLESKREGGGCAQFSDTILIGHAGPRFLTRFQEDQPRANGE